MSDDQKKSDEDGIYRIETVPPPMGESDAYSAPTKVGPMAAAAVEELMKAAEQRASDLSARAAEKRKLAAASASKPPSASPPSSPRPASARPAGEPARAGEAKEARSSAPPSERTGSSGAPAPQLGGKPSSVPAQMASAAKPARRPVPDAIIKPVTATPARAAQPASLSKAAQGAESSAMPRLYESIDEEFDGEYAETLLHKAAQAPVVPPPAATPPMRAQLHTQPMDAGLARAVVQSVDARAAVPPQRASAPPAERPSHQAAAAVVRAQEPMLIWPLVVGMLIFAVGLTWYLLVR